MGIAIANRKNRCDFGALSTHPKKLCVATPADRHREKCLCAFLGVEAHLEKCR